LVSAGRTAGCCADTVVAITTVTITTRRNLILHVSPLSSLSRRLHQTAAAPGVRVPAAVGSVVVGACPVAASFL
jgi:hypothetical protein